MKKRKLIKLLLREQRQRQQADLVAAQVAELRAELIVRNTREHALEQLIAGAHWVALRPECWESCWPRWAIQAQALGIAPLSGEVSPS